MSEKTPRWVPLDDQPLETREKITPPSDLAMQIAEALAQAAEELDGSVYLIGATPSHAEPATTTPSSNDPLSWVSFDGQPATISVHKTDSTAIPVSIETHPASEPQSE
jgi:hypothetical protein